MSGEIISVNVAYLGAIIQLVKKLRANKSENVSSNEFPPNSAAAKIGGYKMVTSAVDASMAAARSLGLL